MKTVHFLLRAALLFIVVPLPAHAEEFEGFEYTATATEVTITGYTGAGGVVTIPDTIEDLPVTSVGNSAFQSKSGLVSVTIPASVTSISYGAFAACTSLTSVTIPASVTSIGGDAFNNCTSLTSVTIPASVTSISYGAFADCTSLTSVTIPANVTSIGGDTFNNCTSLTSVTIPASVTSIGSGAFYRCISLASVTIGNGVTRIEDTAFYNCTSLTSVTIPASVTSIGYAAFNNCINLAGIYFKGNAPYLGDLALLTTSNTLVYYVVGAIGWTSPFGGLNTVALGPPIVTEPLSAINTNVGQNVAFGVAAVSSVPLALSYQWTRNGITIAGASGAELSLSNVQSTDVGNYKVVVTNEYGSVSSMAALTLIQGNLYTQAQFDAALQVGFDLGLQVNDSDVLAAPNNYDLYSLSQVQTLNVGTPLLTKDPASGKFKLTVGVKKSADLSIYTALPFTAGGTTINAQGKIEFEFTSPDNAAFFRLESN